MNEKMLNGVRSYDMDTSKPLDIDFCLKTYVDKSMFFRLLPKFEESGFLDNLHLLAFWVQVGNFYEFMNKAHSIKGGAAYTGASRICNDWFWIQVHFDRKEYVKMIQVYITLLEHSAQFRVHTRVVMAEFYKTKWVIEPEHETVPLPPGWKIEKIEAEEFKVTPLSDYLDLAEEAEKRGKRYEKYEVDGQPLRWNIFYDNDEENQVSRSLDSFKSITENYVPSEYESFSSDHLQIQYNPLICSDSEISSLKNASSVEVEIAHKNATPQEESKRLLNGKLPSPSPPSHIGDIRIPIYLYNSVD